MPATWRGWSDFGTGGLGDMGCHILDHVVWSLKLGAPVSVEACLGNRSMAKKKTVKKSAQVKRSTKAAAKTSRKPAKKPAARKPAGRVKKKPALPRPTIPGEEKLFLLFKDDCHARQVFDFLRVETVHELEQFTPDEIFKRLTRPVAESVERIRRRLAEKRRYLSSDEDYMLAAIRAATSYSRLAAIFGYTCSMANELAERRKWTLRAHGRQMIFVRRQNLGDLT